MSEQIRYVLVGSWSAPTTFRIFRWATRWAFLFSPEVEEEDRFLVYREIQSLLPILYLSLCFSNNINISFMSVFMGFFSLSFKSYYLVKKKVALSVIFVSCML